MIAHLEGKFEQITPTFMVVDCNGVGYGIHISLSTYEKLKGQKSGRVLTHLSIREDDHVLFGFADETERGLFRHLISVTGIGPSSARMMLSSLSPKELFSVIANGNVGLLKTVKGIGDKTAQRIILELQSKLQKEATSSTSILPGFANIHGAQQEASDALVTLGFNRASVEKALAKIAQSNGNNQSIEDMVKQALKVL
jgi:Holliday junction DNA helicase RuvA